MAMNNMPMNNMPMNNMPMNNMLINNMAMNNMPMNNMPMNNMPMNNMLMNNMPMNNMPMNNMPMNNMPMNNMPMNNMPMNNMPMNNMPMNNMPMNNMEINNMSKNNMPMNNIEMMHNMEMMNNMAILNNNRIIGNNMPMNNIGMMNNMGNNNIQMNNMGMNDMEMMNNIGMNNMNNYSNMMMNMNDNFFNINMEWLKTNNIDFNVMGALDNNSFQNIITKISNTKIQFENIFSPLTTQTNISKIVNGYALNDFAQQNKLQLNIIYYDESLKETDENNSNCGFCKMYINGTFYGCDNLNLFNYICKKIKKSNKKFVLITSGSSAEKIYSNCSNLEEIKEYYIYCLNLDKYTPLLYKYPKLKGVYNDFDDLKWKISSINLKNEENIKSSNLIFFADYNKKYIKLHYEIVRKYSLYKLLKSENYNESKFLELVKNKKSYYLDLAKQLLYHDDNDMINFFKTNTDEDEETIRKVFNCDHNIQNYITNHTVESFYYKYLNKFLREEDYNSFRLLSNHISKFIYCLYEYRKQNALNQQKSTLYRIMYITKEEFDIYLQSINKIICYPSFTSTSISDNSYSPINYDINSKCVKLIIEQNNSESVTSIKQISQHECEDEYLFVPFSFFKITNVKQGLGTSNNPHIIYLTALYSKKPLEEMFLSFMENETDNLDPEGLDMLELVNDNKEIILNHKLFKTYYNNN